MSKNRVIEGFFFINSNVGDVFYTEKSNKHIDSISRHYPDLKVKVSVVSVVEIVNKEPIAKRLSKVTITHKKDKKC
jgi:hypothetical protein